MNERAIKVAARRLAYDAWPLASEDERVKWAIWHWKEWEPRATKAIEAYFSALSPLQAREEIARLQEILKELAEPLNYRQFTKWNPQALASEALTILSSAAGQEWRDTPVAWVYELADGYDKEKKEYSHWNRLISFRKPTVPEGSIRDLQPLYALPAPPVAKPAT